MADSQIVNLDAAAAARAEAEGKNIVVLFKGAEYELGSEISFAVIEALGDLSEAQDSDDQGKMYRAFVDVAKAFLGDKFEDFSSAHPTLGDFQSLVEGVVKAYGLGEDAGESSASES